MFSKIKNERVVGSLLGVMSVCSLCLNFTSGVLGLLTIGFLLREP